MYKHLQTSSIMSNTIRVLTGCHAFSSHHGYTKIKKLHYVLLCQGRGYTSDDRDDYIVTKIPSDKYHDKGRQQNREARRD